MQERIRGQKKTITITRDTFNTYVNEILNYKRDKDDIMRTPGFLPGVLFIPLCEIQG